MAFETGGEKGRPGRSLCLSANEKGSLRRGELLAKSVTPVTLIGRVAVREAEALCTDTRANYPNIRALSREKDSVRRTRHPWNIP